MKKLLTVLTALVLSAPALAGVESEFLLGAGGVSPDHGDSYSGVAAGWKIEQFGDTWGGGIRAEGVFSGEHKSGGKGELELYRKVAGDKTGSLWAGFHLGLAGTEWRNSEVTIDGQKTKSDWGGLVGQFVGPAVRLRALDGAFNLDISYLISWGGEYRVSLTEEQSRLIGDTYISPDTDYRGISVYAEFQKTWKDRYFFGVAGEYTRLSGDSENQKIAYGGQLHTVQIDSTDVNVWGVGVMVGMRF